MSILHARLLWERIHSLLYYCCYYPIKSVRMLAVESSFSLAPHITLHPFCTVHRKPISTSTLTLKSYTSNAHYFTTHAKGPVQFYRPKFLLFLSSKMPYISLHLVFHVNCGAATEKKHKQRIAKSKCRDKKTAATATPYKFDQYFQKLLTQWSNLLLECCWGTVESKCQNYSLWVDVSI